MGTPTTPQTDQHHQGDLERDQPNTGQEWLECLAGGTVALLAVVLVLPIIVELIRPLGVLSTTALVSIFVITWAVFWTILGIAREQVRKTAWAASRR